MIPCMLKSVICGICLQKMRVRYGHRKWNLNLATEKGLSFFYIMQGGMVIALCTSLTSQLYLFYFNCIFDYQMCFSLRIVSEFQPTKVDSNQLLIVLSFISIRKYQSKRCSYRVLPFSPQYSPGGKSTPKNNFLTKNILSFQFPLVTKYNACAHHLIK